MASKRPTMFESPVGLGQYMWINTPDTKYNPDGVFKDQLILSASLPATQNLIALIDEQCEEAFKRQTDGLSAGELKKWKLYKPYVEEEDKETGEPTGNVIFTFKRNHIITLQGGEKRELSIAIYDAQGNSIPGDDQPRIFSGTKHKVLFSFRDVKVPGTKQAGAKMDFAAIKVFELGQGSGGSAFSKDEGDPEGGFTYKPGSGGPKAQSDADDGGEF